MGSSRHVRETYYLAGEGVYEGRGRRAPDTREDTRSFRFSRLGPKGAVLPQELLAVVARAMTAPAPGADAAGMPAGYTYVGQFIDHDLTKDVTGAALGSQVSVEDLLQGRSPALDLDSLYGRGPMDLYDRAFYADDARLRMGTTASIDVPRNDAGVAVDRPGFDLPRVGVDPTRPQTRADQRAPLIPDARNDENLAVAQTHLAFIRFHNRVVDSLAVQGVPAEQLFDRARRTVVRHYQWMVRTDFLPRIVDPAIVDDVFTHGRRYFEAGETYPASRPTMPVEFSIAAFRFGHSMIRGSYDWNRVFRSGGLTPASLLLLFAFSGVSGTFVPVTAETAHTLNDPNSGLLRLPSNWVADFRRLFDFGRVGDPALVPPEGGPNLAERIDARLVDPLTTLPLGSFGGTGTTPPPIELNLAYRNLVRAGMVELASGQQLAELMAVTPLTDEQLLVGAGGPDLSGLDPDQQAAFLADTPLWFYVLREAEHNGGRLTGVGGRIVAEVFHRALEGSRTSIVRDPQWRPSLGDSTERFDMVDLLLYAADGKVEVLNPLGDAAPAVAPDQQIVLTDGALTPR
ncbi:MAG TPA: heme peroxidase family protein [Mycobacteriales bacterium]|jgi:hypothetical protein|nr:heme peroxidase family protein [Mycobacteriales bacterium]